MRERSEDMRLPTAALLIAALSVAAVARAQAPATSFAELAGRVKAGQTVSVTTESGEVIRGEVAHVSDTMLTLTRPGRDLAARDVRRVDRSTTCKRRGALIGFGLGFSIGGLAAATDDCSGIGPCFGSPAGVLSLGGVVGLLGAGVGAVVGARVHANQVVFLRTIRLGVKDEVREVSAGSPRVFEIR